MSAFLFVTALVLAALPGSAVLWACTGRPQRRFEWTALVAGGAVLGLLLASIATRLPGVEVPERAFAATLPWLLPALLACVAVAWARRGNAAVPSPRAESGGSPTALWWALLALCVLHVLLAAWQAGTLPTVPWDAWTTWAGRARAWLASGTFAPFVTVQQWLASTDPALRATLAPHYPEGLPRLLVWVASAGNGWNPALLHLLWPLLGATLGAALYAELRRAGGSPTVAMLAAFACLSLPLVNAHMALAGYADLWVATVLLLAVMHCLHWQQGRGAGHLCAAILYAAMLPVLKLEGAVWLACLALAAAWAVLPRRVRWALPLAALLLVAVVLSSGTLPLPIPGLGLVRLTWGMVEVPGMGSLALHWRPVGGEVLATLFAWRNWHLLWVAVPLLLTLRWRVLLGNAGLRTVAMLLLLGYGFLFVLFFFTDASAWAENLTSINRLLLHLAPTSIAVAALCWVAPRAGTQPASSER